MSRYHLCVLLALSIISALGSCTNTRENSQESLETQVEPVVVEVPKSEINIKGKWVSKDNPLYPIFEFKGKSTVSITTVLGPMVTRYDRDEEFIRVDADPSDLLLEVLNEDTITGSGYAKGIWIKQR